MDKSARGRRRILHVVRQFPPSYGGLEEYVLTLVDRQAPRDRVTVLTLNRLFGSPTRLKRIERRGRAIIVRTGFVGGQRLFLPFVSAKFFRRFDLIHVHALDQLADVVSLLTRRSGPPFVFTSHGLFFHTAALARIKEIYFKLISRRTLARAKVAFAVSRPDQLRLEQIGVEARLLNNPANAFPFCYAGGRDLIYWGRIAENKDVPKLLLFIAALLKSGSDRLLHIVGGGDPGIIERLDREIAALGLGSHVRRHGFLSRADLQALLPQCGFAVSASRYEGYGIAQVEAMTAGLLPIMQTNDAFRALFEQSGSGLLVDFDDPQAASESFLAWEATIALDHRQRAREFGLSRDWTATAREIDDVYNLILSP